MSRYRPPTLSRLSARLATRPRALAAGAWPAPRGRWPRRCVIAEGNHENLKTHVALERKFECHNDGSHKAMTFLRAMDSGPTLRCALSLFNVESTVHAPRNSEERLADELPAAVWRFLSLELRQES